jgi:hypothetical protein
MSIYRMDIPMTKSEKCQIMNPSQQQSVHV